MKEFHYGFSARKAKYLAEFLGRPIQKLIPTAGLCERDKVYIWGDAKTPDLPPRVEVVRVEDGFIRSAGLGAAFAEPISWVFDTRGLHHIGDRETDLEVLIKNADQHPGRTVRAAALASRIRSQGITKYNVGAAAWTPPHAARKANERILIVGQVANDAAVRSITTPVRTNIQLLKAARKMRPDAYIIYKQHPDVVAGLRDGNDEDTMQCADVIVKDVSVDAVLPHVDEVHVMTSLTGFEALIRGKSVVCHAWPFYAGWGLTNDIHPHPRRGVSRSLDQVLGAALIGYARYRDPITRRPCTPEEAVDHIANATQIPKDEMRGAQELLKLMAGRMIKLLGITDRKTG